MKSFPQPLTAAEEKYYVQKYTEGDLEAKHILIERNLRLVAHIVKKYQPPPEEMEDLLSIGTIGLMKAVVTFDPEKSARLATYAARCIENELLMHFRGKKKSSKEVSLYEPIGTDREGNEIQLFDVIEMGEEDVHRRLEKKEDVIRLYQKVESELSARERIVLKLRYGLYVIVCTHPMCVKAIASYKEKTGLSTPLVTCITDISMHPEWKADQTDLYLAPTREIKEHLICEGTKAENILVTGIPVRQQFLNMDRKHLENEKEVRRVLVMGGGLGLMPDLRRLLGKLHSMQSVQTIVITGKNHKMYEEWVNRYEDVKVLGYTENISKYMRWADLVITKAGGITLFEILHSQVPLFVIHPFLEQEMNNARYAAEKGFAKVVWGKHEDYIPELEKLLNDRKLLKQMDENVRHARKEMIDVSLDKAVEIMEERMTA